MILITTDVDSAPGFWHHERVSRAADVSEDHTDSIIRVGVRNVGEEAGLYRNRRWIRSWTLATQVTGGGGEKEPCLHLNNSGLYGIVKWKFETGEKKPWKRWPF